LQNRTATIFFIASCGLRSLSALNKIKKEENDCKMVILAEAESELVVQSYFAWRWLKMAENCDLVLLNLEHARAPKGNTRKNPFYPINGKKPFYTGN